MCIYATDESDGGLVSAGDGGGGFTPRAPGGDGGTGGGNGALLVSAPGSAGIDPNTGAVSPISGQPSKQYNAPGEGTGPGQRVWDAAAYLKQFPDVASEYAKVNGPGLAQGLGLSNDPKANLTDAQFAEWHISQPGNGDFRTAYYGTGAAAASDPAADTKKTTDDLITNLTKGFTDAMTGLQTQNQTLIDQLTTSGTNFTNMVQGMQTSFAKSQSDLMTQMQAASKSQSDSMMKAIKDAQAQSGQKEKKPSYGRALDKNKQLNGGGLGSTGITGSGGVPVGSLILGATSLLGGGA